MYSQLHPIAYTIYLPEYMLSALCYNILISFVMLMVTFSFILYIYVLEFKKELVMIAMLVA